MTLVQTYGKPDILLTMTCNPNWNEIKYQLLPGQSSQDHPDLITRIFKSKFEECKKYIVDKGVLSKVCSYSYVIEYQKRGLAHVHMLVIFENNDKLCTPDHFDSIVRAEIPSQTEELNLHKAVVRHMIHGPCGSINPNCPCMVNDKCKKNFPKPFVEYTSRGNDSYPLYRRREGGQVSITNNDNVFIDNGWVVPYNPLLLLKYDCHINVDVCGGIKCVKYIYKYIHKGPDRVALELRNGQNCDEIQQYVDGRLLHHYKKKLDDFDLPSISGEFLEATTLPRIIEDEISYQISDDDLRPIERLNAHQRIAFDTIIESIMHNRSKLFFIDGPGDLIRRASAIVWDEAPMANRYAFESVSKSFQDIMDNHIAFGGKTIVFGGDFRQVLPVVKRGSKAEQIAASISRSTFWHCVKIIHLQQNMRSAQDIDFSQFLLRIGDGLQHTVNRDFIKLPDSIIIP
ncbi:uncharacterized protein [Primulina eburnea]|uniref:uncharacterized protein n=1 Tax=Primulina eburnea TaxID=1245227 RepID=UPI003C6CC464